MNKSIDDKHDLSDFAGDDATFSLVLGSFANRPIAIRLPLPAPQEH
jgi:hypothetical protein